MVANDNAAAVEYVRHREPRGKFKRNEELARWVRRGLYSICPDYELVWRPTGGNPANGGALEERKLQDATGWPGNASVLSTELMGVLRRTELRHGGVNVPMSD